MNNTQIILPTYNEVNNIASIIGYIHSIVPDIRILVVDDNSPDKTAAVVQTLVNRNPLISLIVREKKDGLGRAYLHAFDHVLRDPSIRRVIMMDADFSHDPMYIPIMIRESKSADFVIGSRYCQGGATEGWETWRKWLSRSGNTYCRLVTGLPVSDATAGFNLICTDILKRTDLAKLNSSGYAFQVELKYAVWKKGARFAETPIVFKNRREGESKLSNHIIAEAILAPWMMRFKK